MKPKEITVMCSVNGTDLLFLVVGDAVSAGDVFSETLDPDAADVADARLPLHLHYRLCIELLDSSDACCGICATVATRVVTARALHLVIEF